MNKALAILLLMITILSCGERKDYYNELTKPGDNLFRGVNLRDSYKDVMNAENADNIEADEKVYLKFKYLIDSKNESSGHFQLEYYFDGEDQLHEIIMNIFITDKAESKKVYDRLVKSYSKSYGDPEKNEEGYLVWKGTTENTPDLEVAIIDDSKFSENSGYITLQINDFDY